jgi:hypothetical protein
LTPNSLSVSGNVAVAWSQSPAPRVDFVISLSGMRTMRTGVVIRFVTPWRVKSPVTVTSTGWLAAIGVAGSVTETERKVARGNFLVSTNSSRMWLSRRSMPVSMAVRSALISTDEAPAFAASATIVPVTLGVVPLIVSTASSIVNVTAFLAPAIVYVRGSAARGRARAASSSAAATGLMVPAVNRLTASRISRAPVVTPS